VIMARQAGPPEQSAAVTRVEPRAAAVIRGQLGRKIGLGRAHQHSVYGRSAARLLGDAFLVGASVSVLSNGAIRSASYGRSERFGCPDAAISLSSTLNYMMNARDVKSAKAILNEMLETSRHRLSQPSRCQAVESARSFRSFLKTLDLGIHGPTRR
jgi:hypothetical protein